MDGLIKSGVVRQKVSIRVFCRQIKQLWRIALALNRLHYNSSKYLQRIFLVYPSDQLVLVLVVLFSCTLVYKRMQFYLLVIFKFFLSSISFCNRCIVRWIFSASSLACLWDFQYEESMNSNLYDINWFHYIHTFFLY